MRPIVLALLLQALAAPDPAQLENAPALGYLPVPATLRLPAGIALGAPSAVAFNRDGHLLIFNRGDHPLIEVEAGGAFVRSFGEGMYRRPHGMRLDSQGNIWTTDVAAHTVTKLAPDGHALLVLGSTGQAGDWNEAAGSRLLNEPNDVAVAPSGEFYVVQGHGRGDPRVLKFASNGAFVKSWGGTGTGPGQFNIAHSIVIDDAGLVYVADRQNRRVQIFDANGTFVREWKYAGLPCGLFIDGDGQMYLVTGYAGQILKLDRSGKALGAAGQPGKGLGEFGEAHYVTVGPAGDIYVADTVGSRLHKFVRK
jgi:DNA-binding beta-propeller fold protein YncE